MQYKVIRDTKSYNKAGLNPTTKNGTEMGIVRTGFIFSDVGNQNGWLAIASNKWVKLSDCEQTTVTPPPVDPPPVEYETIEMRRHSYDGGVTWTPYEYYGIRKL